MKWTHSKSLKWPFKLFKEVGVWFISPELFFKICSCTNKRGHMSLLITSDSSCTSSMVGHGSAICARGILAGFSLSPPLAPLSRGFLLLLLLSGAVPRGAAPHSGPKVQGVGGDGEGGAGFSALQLQTKMTRAAQPRALQTIVIPVIWLQRRLATCVCVCVCVCVRVYLCVCVCVFVAW